MKATLITLLAGAGIVSATTVEPVFHMDFNNSSSPLAFTSASSLTGITVTATDGTASLVNGTPAYLGSGSSYSNSAVSGQSIKINLSGAITYTSDFTVTLTVRMKDGFSNVANWRNVFQLGDEDNHVRIQSNTLRDGSKPGIGLYGNGTLSADSPALNTSQDKQVYLGTDWVRLTLTYDYEENKGGLFTLYANDAQIAHSQAYFNAAGKNIKPTTLGLGAGVAGTPLGQLYFDEVGVYTAALTQSEIKNFLVDKKTGAVPEPTTATLSLLALAGLAARRRRK